MSESNSDVGELSLKDIVDYLTPRLIKQHDEFVANEIPNNVISLDDFVAKEEHKTEKMIVRERGQDLLLMFEDSFGDAGWRSAHVLWKKEYLYHRRKSVPKGYDDVSAMKAANDVLRKVYDGMMAASDILYMNSDPEYARSKFKLV